MKANLYIGCLCLLLAACDDKAPAGDNDARTDGTALLERDGEGPRDVSDCCEKITCLSNDKVCDPRSCQCEVSADVSPDAITDAQPDTADDLACVPFDSSSSCAAGLFCRPRAFDPDTRVWTGRCEAPSGTGALGAVDCERNGCGPDLECVDDVCEQLCDPHAESASDPGSCPDRTCVELLLPNGDQSVYGACLDSCTPYVLNDGCPLSMWCFPAYFTAGAGVCESSDGGVRGDSCAPNRGCGAGLLCIDGFCARVCDPSAESGNEPGFCSDPTTRCLPVGRAGVEFQFGHCAFVCDPIQQNCPQASDACFFAELGESGLPECFTPSAELDVGASCVDAGLEQLDACGANRFCIDDICVQLCVVAEAGEFDQSNRGCAVSEVCRQLGTAPLVGHCE